MEKRTTVQNNFLNYSTPNEVVRVDVFIEDETVWLTQKAMGELFGVVKSTISGHLSNIYETNELIRDATVRDFRTVVNVFKSWKVNTQLPRFSRQLRADGKN